MKKSPKIIIILTIILFTFAFSSSASAYNLQQGKLKGGIRNKKYYLGLTNQIYITACITAMNDWNYAVQYTPETSNMGFNFTRTYNILDASLRFWGEHLPNQAYAGTTRYYVFNSSGGVTAVTNNYNRDYADLIFNTANAPTYNATYMSSLAAHEAGHGLGLGHTTDIGTLMFQGVNVRTASVPTRDEVLGIYAHYR